MINTNEECLSKEQYECIDIIKLLSSFLVIGAHAYHFNLYETPFWKLFSYGIQGYLVRVAVPFFFVATGFFVFRHINKPKECFRVAVNYAQKTYRLYFLWSILYLPFILHSILNCTQGIGIGIIYFCRSFIFAGSYNHLWYLTAVAFAVLLTGFLLSKDIKLELILKWAVILYLIGLLGQSYFGLIYPLHNYPAIWNVLKTFINVTVTTRNGLFDAFLFVAMGIYFAFRPIKMKLRTAIIGFAASMMVFLGEILLLIRLGWIRESDMYLSIVPALFFLFYISIHMKPKESPIYLKLRHISTLTYFSHVWLLTIIYKLFAILGITWLNYGMLLVLTMTACVLVSFLVIKLSNISKLRFLKNLYS